MVKIRLGHRYRDIILGIEGVALELGRHLTGCDRLQCRCVDEEGNEVHLTNDVTRLKLVPGSKVLEHTSVKSNIKLGDIYQDTTTGMIGHAVVTLERVGMQHMLVVLTYKDAKTGMPAYMTVDEPVLKKLAANTQAQALAEAAARVVKDNAKKEKPGPGPDMTTISRDCL
jgi:hypothetical protein